MVGSDYKCKKPRQSDYRAGQIFSAIQPPMSLETNYCLARPFSWMEGGLLHKSNWHDLVYNPNAVSPHCLWLQRRPVTSRCLILWSPQHLGSQGALHMLTLHTVSHTHGLVLLQSTPLQLSQGLAQTCTRSKKGALHY